LKAFLDNHEKVMIIAFGTMFSPTNETLRTIIKYVKHEKSYAFVVAVKRKSDY
jgi:hypothetical protein